MPGNEVVIDRLIVSIEGDIDELKKAYKKGEQNNKKFVKNTEKETKKLRAAWSKASKGIAAGLALIGGSAVLSKITRTTATLANMQAQLDKLGTSAEFLQTFRAAGAEVANLDFRAVDMGLQRIIRRLGDARNGVQESAKIFRQLGVDISQSTETVIKDTIDAISSLQTAEERLSVTVKLVDSEAAGLVAVFSKTSAVLDVAAAKTQKYGAFVDEFVIKKGAELDREYRRILEGLERRWQKLIVTIATGLGGKDTSVAGQLQSELDTVEKRLQGLTQRFANLTAANDDNASAMSKVFATNASGLDLMAGRLDEMVDTQLADTETSIAALTEQWTLLNEQINATPEDPFAALGGDKPPAAGGKGLNFGETAGEDTKATVADFIQGLQEELAIIQQVGLAREQLRAVTLASHIEEAALTDQQINKIKELTAAIHEQENAEVSAAEKFKEIGENMEEAFIDGLIAGEDVGDMLKQMIIDLGKAIIKAALLNLFTGGTGGGLGSALGGLFGGGKASGGSVRPGKFFEVNEGGRKEFFQPDVPGKVINPAVAGQGMAAPSAGMQLVINNNFAPGVTRAELAEALPEMERRTVASVMEGVRRGGVQRKTITGRV